MALLDFLRQRAETRLDTLELTLLLGVPFDEVAVGEQQQYVGFRVGEGPDDMDAVAVAGIEQFFDVVVGQGADLIDGPVDGDVRIAPQQAGKRQQELAQNQKMR